MSKQERRCPRICPIPDKVRDEHKSHFRPLKIFLAPFYQDFYSVTIPRRVSQMYFKFKDSLESQYKEALHPRHDNLRSMYHYPHEYDHFKHLPDSISEDILPIGLYLLLLMSKAVHDNTDVLGYNDEVTREILDLKEVDDYKHDMLLYENQIPLEILEVIVSIRKPEMQPRDIRKLLIELILGFFHMPKFEEKTVCLHILDVYRKSLLQHPKSSQHPISIYSRKKPNLTKLPVIPSATRLQEARIRIKISSTSLTDISFSNKALHLPQFSLHTGTESILHNLVWFEKLDPDAGLHFSSYIYFSSNLLKEPADSNLLKDLDIINTAWDDDKVVGLFKELGKSIDDNPSKLMDSHLLNLGQQLRARYNKNSQVWRKDLFQTYLKSPWAISSLIVALIIFFLTVLQTVYTVLGFYKS